MESKDSGRKQSEPHIPPAENDKLLQQLNTYKHLAPIITTVVKVDKEIQQKIIEKTPEVVTGEAVEHFENALITNKELLESMSQHSDCLPLFEKRKQLLEAIVEKGGKVEGVSVLQFRKAAELINQKQEVELELKKGLCALEPSLQESDLVAIESLEANVTLNHEVLEKLPQFKGLIPLAEKKSDIDIALLDTGLFPREELFSAPPQKAIIVGSTSIDGITVQKHWWGVSVDITHERFENFFQSTNWVSALTGALGSLLSGPSAIVVGVIATFAKVYGSGLKRIEKGNGMRFHVPWFAIYPFPSALYVIPIPL